MTSTLNCPECGRWLAGRVGVAQGFLTLHCRRCNKNWEWAFAAGRTSVREVERPPRPGEPAPPRGTG